MKAGVEAGIVQRALDGQGHLSHKRDDHKRLMYNRDKFRWYYYSNGKKEDAIAMEAEAQEIIGKIVSLLAGQPITNDTVWDRDGNGHLLYMG